jgi:hypothetical protein
MVEWQKRKDPTHPFASMIEHELSADSLVTSLPEAPTLDDDHPVAANKEGTLVCCGQKSRIVVDSSEGAFSFLSDYLAQESLDASRQVLRTR